MQAIGADIYNGTSVQLTGFRDATGATYPLLLNAATATGGNLSTLYGPWDNYIVINKQGIVRYHAANIWPHGNRYHLNEILGTIDSLVSATVGVSEAPRRGELSLSAAPNPFHGVVTVELALPEPAAVARLHVLDVSGRRIATLHDGPLPAGMIRLAWDAASAEGAKVPPGIYLLAGELDGRRLSRRIVRLP